MNLADRGRSLEEAFFMQRDVELIEQRRKLDETQKTRESLAQVSRIRNPLVLDKLVELAVSPVTLASLMVLPLVEVAWADGHLDEKEKAAVLVEAAKAGVTPGSIAYDLLNSWLKERPSPKFLEAWTQYIIGLREVMAPKEIVDLKFELLDWARKVANAGGGFLGLSKVSAQEQAILKKMENSF